MISTYFKDNPKHGTQQGRGLDKAKMLFQFGEDLFKLDPNACQHNLSKMMKHHGEYRQSTSGADSCKSLETSNSKETAYTAGCEMTVALHELSDFRQWVMPGSKRESFFKLFKSLFNPLLPQMTKDWNIHIADCPPTNPPISKQFGARQNKNRRGNDCQHAQLQ